MKTTMHDDVMLCEKCLPEADLLTAARLVGPGSVFRYTCPHIEAMFLKWHEKLRAEEPPQLRHVWQQFCIGFILGGALGVWIFGWVAGVGG